MSVCFTDMQPRTRQVISWQSSVPDRPHDWANPQWNATFWRVYPQIWPLHHVCTGSLDVMKLSDFTPDQVMVNTALYCDYLRPNDERYGIVVPLISQLGHIRTFGLFRWDRDFAEAERDLLTLLSPHLAAVYHDHQRRQAGIPQLTRRQKDVLRALAQGLSTEQVAQAMVVSISTVRKHLENIYKRLGVTNRAAAVLAYDAETARSLVPASPAGH